MQQGQSRDELCHAGIIKHTPTTCHKEFCFFQNPLFRAKWFHHPCPRLTYLQSGVLKYRLSSVYFSYIYAHIFVDMCMHMHIPVVTLHANIFYYIRVINAREKKKSLCYFMTSHSHWLMKLSLWGSFTCVGTKLDQHSKKRFLGQGFHSVKNHTRLLLLDLLMTRQQQMVFSRQMQESYASSANRT